MKAQQKYRMVYQRTRNVAVVVGLMAVLVGGLISLWAQQTPSLLPRPTVVLGSSSLARPVTTNRIFQDEIIAASVLDLGDSTTPFFQWPERLSDMRAPTASPARAIVIWRRPAIANRFFLDEIAGAQAQGSATLATTGEITLQSGPQ